MIGEILKGKASEVESSYVPVKDLPCFKMDMGDVWVAPDEYKDFGPKIHTQASNGKMGISFKTKTIDGKLHVWRKS